MKRKRRTSLVRTKRINGSRSQSVFSKNRKVIVPKRLALGLSNESHRAKAISLIHKWLSTLSSGSGSNKPLLLRGTVSSAILNKETLITRILKEKKYNLIFPSRNDVDRLDAMACAGLRGTNAFVIDADVFQKIPKKLPGSHVIVVLCSDPYKWATANRINSAFCTVFVGDETAMHKLQFKKLQFMDVFSFGPPWELMKLVAVDSNFSFEEKIRVAGVSSQKLVKVISSNVGVLISETDTERLARLTAHVSDMDMWGVRMPRKYKSSVELLFAIRIANVKQKSRLSYKRDHVTEKLTKWRTSAQGRSMNKWRTVNFYVDENGNSVIKTNILPEEKMAVLVGGNAKKKKKPTVVKCCTVCRNRRYIEIPIKGHFCPFK